MVFIVWGQHQRNFVKTFFFKKLVSLCSKLSTANGEFEFWARNGLCTPNAGNNRKLGVNWFEA